MAKYKTKLLIDNEEFSKRLNWDIGKKISETKKRIIEWYESFDSDVYISFSGGKDSTVLLHIARQIYPDIEAVFCNTGVEYPEIVRFAKSFKNLTVLKPKYSFKDICEKYGYPVISKQVATQMRFLQNPKPCNENTRRFYLTGIRKDGTMTKVSSMILAKKWRFLIDAPFKISEYCCNHLKKYPAQRFQKESGKAPIFGTMASESHIRKKHYMYSGCNSYEKKKSDPMSFWTTEDVWKYMGLNNIKYCKVYDLPGVERTGCIYCMFGIQFEKEPNRFQRLKETHPKHYKYAVEKIGIGKILDYIGVGY